jgi:hypothetical protein
MIENILNELLNINVTSKNIKKEKPAIISKLTTLFNTKALDIKNLLSENAKKLFDLFNYLFYSSIENYKDLGLVELVSQTEITFLQISSLLRLCLVFVQNIFNVAFSNALFFIESNEIVEGISQNVTDICLKELNLFQNLFSFFNFEVENNPLYRLCSVILLILSSPSASAGRVFLYLCIYVYLGYYFYSFSNSGDYSSLSWKNY